MPLYSRPAPFGSVPSTTILPAEPAVPPVPCPCPPPPSALPPVELPATGPCPPLFFAGPLSSGPPHANVSETNPAHSQCPNHLGSRIRYSFNSDRVPLLR